MGLPASRTEENKCLFFKPLPEDTGEMKGLSIGPNASYWKGIMAEKEQNEQRPRRREPCVGFQET